MPVGEVIYTMVIASKTGWSEEFIRWELPLARGWAYFHAARLMDGERCRWPGASTGVGRWVDGVRGWLKKTKTTRAEE
jgi:hypothetical protein